MLTFALAEYGVVVAVCLPVMASLGIAAKVLADTIKLLSETEKAVATALSLVERLEAHEEARRTKGKKRRAEPRSREQGTEKEPLELEDA